MSESRMSVNITALNERDAGVAVKPIRYTDSVGVGIHLFGIGHLYIDQDTALDLAEKLSDCVGEIRREEAQC